MVLLGWWLMARVWSCHRFESEWKHTANHIRVGNRNFLKHIQAIIFLGKSLVHCWVSGTAIHFCGLVLMLTPGQGKLLLFISGLLRVVWGVV